MRYCPAVFVSPKVVVASPRTRRKVAVAPVMAGWPGVLGGVTGLENISEGPCCCLTLIPLVCCWQSWL